MRRDGCRVKRQSATRIPARRPSNTPVNPSTTSDTSDAPTAIPCSEASKGSANIKLIRTTAAQLRKIRIVDSLLIRDKTVKAGGMPIPENHAISSRQSLTP
jgi:hypothetical protein